MWSSLKSSIKSAASEIVREAEERERREKELRQDAVANNGNNSDAVYGTPEAASGLFQNTSSIMNEELTPSTAEAFFGHPPESTSNVQSDAPTTQSHIFNDDTPQNQIFTNTPVVGFAETNPSAFSGANDFVGSDLVNGTAGDLASGAKSFFQTPRGDGSRGVSTNHPNQEMTGSDEGQIKVESSGMFDIDLDENAASGGRFSTPNNKSVIDENKSELDSIDLDSPLSNPLLSQVKEKLDRAPAESPISLAMKGTFQHLSKLKQMTSSVVASTLPTSREEIVYPDNTQDSDDDFLTRLNKARTSPDVDESVLNDMDEQVATVWRKLKENKRQNANSGNVQEIKKLKQVVIAKDKELEELREQISTKDSFINKMTVDSKTHQEKLLNTIAARDNELSVAHARISDLESSAVQGEEQNKLLIDSREHIQQLEQQLAELRNSPKLSETIAELNRTIDLQEERIQESAEALNKAQHDLEVAERKAAELQVQLDTQASAAVEAAQKELQHIKREITAAGASNSRLNSERTALQEANKDIETALKNSTRVLKALKEEEQKLLDSMPDMTLAPFDNLFNEEVAGMLSDSVQGASRLEVARKRSNIAGGLHSVLIDTLLSRIDQLSAVCAKEITHLTPEPLPIPKPTTTDEAVATIVEAVKHSLASVELIEPVSIEPIEPVSIEQNEEGDLKSQFERMSEVLAAAKLADTTYSLTSDIQFKEMVASMQSGEEKLSSSSEQLHWLVEKYASEINLHYNKGKKLLEQYQALSSTLLYISQAVVAAVPCLLNQPQTTPEKIPEEDNSMCDKSVAANVVTICIERNCRRDCLEVVARVLSFSEEQRKRVGLDAGSGFWSSLIPNFARGQAKAQQVNVNDQSFSTLLSDFIIDETS